MKKAFLLLFLSAPCFGLETGWKAPTGTDNLGGWTDSTNTYILDGRYALMSSASLERWKDFNFGLPDNVVIQGIRVRATGSCVGAFGTTLNMALSWNGGTNTSSVRSTTLPETTDDTLTVGASTDTWGHLWRTSEFSNTNFRLNGYGQNFVFCNGRVDFFEINVEYEYPATRFFDSILYGGVFY